MTTQAKNTRIVDLAEHFLPTFLFGFKFEGDVLLLLKQRLVLGLRNISKNFERLI